jgi:myo-inositol-1-phosphate synthase
MKEEIRIGIIGVGNCAAALIQGIEYYRHLEGLGAPVQGLMEAEIGHYNVGSIRVAAAFDVSSDKVGRDVSDALKSPLICTRHIVEVPFCDVMVVPGPALDGIGSSAAEVVLVDEGAKSNLRDCSEITALLRGARVDVLINYLPVGSRLATEFYVSCALEAGCAFVNAIPVPIGRDAKWRQAFANAKLPLIGDDVKSQVGATIVHRALAELFSARGYHLDETYQLNVGGNMDFLNMMSRDRLSDKRRSKAQAILDVANCGDGLPEGAFHISPSDHIPFLKDRKIAFIRLEGTGFAGAPIEIELRMAVEDSPNSAGVVVDAIRYAKIALDAGVGGYLAPVSAWLMKAPAYPLQDAKAKLATEQWLADTTSGFAVSEL